MPLRGPSNRRCCAFAALACASVLGACAEPTDDARVALAGAELRIVDSHPQPGEVMESDRVIVDLCFSHRLDPDSVVDENLRLRSGFVFYDSSQRIQLANWYAPGAEEIASESWCEGSILRLKPGGTIPAGVSYRLDLREGLRAWTGETLDTEAEGWITPTPPDTDGEDLDPEDLEPRWSLQFSVAPDAASPEDEEPEEPEPALSLETLFAPGAVFDPNAGACSCHALEGQLALDLLDLRSATAAFPALVEETRLRSSGFPMVTPGDPASSFLMQKLIHAEGRALPSVFGDPMPPAQQLSPAQLGEIANWIELGAQP